MNRTKSVSEVSRVVQDYIQGTANSDVALLKSVFHENALMSGVLGGKASVGGIEPFLATIETQKVEASYRAQITELTVDDAIATAIIVEDDLYGLSFITKFQLLKEEGAWKIVAKLFRHD